MKFIIRMEPLFYLSLFVFTGCDRFPRDNPIDPVNTDGGASRGDPVIVLAEDPTIDDRTEYSERNNRNGVVEPGETIRFVAELTNEGATTARGVAADIASKHDCVVSATVQSTSVGSAQYGDIESNRIGPSLDTVGSFYYEVVFSSTKCSAGDTVDVSLAVRDVDNHHWDIPLELKIVASDLSVEIEEQRESDTVQNAQCNEDNTSLEIGEIFQIDIRIRNIGSSLARNVQARLSWDSASCIRFPFGEQGKSEWISYGDIEPGSSKKADQSEGFLVETRADECVEGQLDFKMEVRDTSERFFNQPLTLPINSIVLERFDVNLVYDDEKSVDDNTNYSDKNYENNGDNKANPGEVFYLNVNFKNEGSVSAQSVRFTIDTDQAPSRCVRKWYLLTQSDREPADDRLDYDEILPNERVPGWTFEVRLSDEDCKSGENIEWIVKAETACTKEMTIPLSVTVE